MLVPIKIAKLIQEESINTVKPHEPYRINCVNSLITCINTFKYFVNLRTSYMCSSLTFCIIPYIYICTIVHTCIHTYVRTYVRTYIRTYVHTYISDATIIVRYTIYRDIKSHDYRDMQKINIVI